ncbi:MAG: DUF177 domain-containing protein [Clostridia bacterium]|nr:DUF177 domain-containing protein [Clostridia bacterium]
MVVSVNEALRRVGEPFPFSWEGELKPQTFAGDPVTFVGTAKLSGAYVYDGKTFRVDADAEASYETTCARCNKPMVKTLAFSFTEHFVRSVYKTEDDELYPYEGEKLDLTEAFFDNLFLEMPMTAVCSESCRGLCPVCGADLNRGQCDCQKNKIDARFSALESLLNDHKEV